MANTSLADGTLKAVGTYESIQSFLRVNRFIRDEFYYGFTITDVDDLILKYERNDIGTLTIVNNNEHLFEFTGYGRWSFEQTLKHLFRWVVEESKNNRKWSPELTLDLKRLNDYPLELTFTYTDDDSPEFLVDEVAKLTWSPGQIESNTLTIVESHTFEPSAKSIVEQSGGEAYDLTPYTVMAIDNNPAIDWIKEIKQTSWGKDLPVDKLSDPVKRQTFVDELSNMLEDEHNTIYYAYDEWFNDMTIVDYVTELLED